MVTQNSHTALMQPIDLYMYKAVKNEDYEITLLKSFNY